MVGENSGPPGAARCLILASGSPQRREILARLGLEFEVIVPDVPEVSGGDPERDVLENARRKATAVSERLGCDPAAGDGPAVADAGDPPVIIACDTDVAEAGRILGKPRDEAEAREYLNRLSGRDHEVISAVVVHGLPATDQAGGRPGAMTREGIQRSTVRFRELSEAQIDWYVGTGEWRGRAGGYAIQGYGSALVAAVDGDLSNVIGLPVPVLVSLAPEIFG